MRSRITSHQSLVTGFLLSCLLASCLLWSCAARGPTKPGAVYENITTAIAGAGAAANQAEKEYQAGQIPQTATNRNLINGLGAAYNDARSAYLVYLAALASYQQAEQAQLAACSPDAGKTYPQSHTTPASCPAATMAASIAQAQVGTAQTTLNLKVASMAAATSQVQALSK